MANLQLIRSFVLTTLLTVLVSLFFRNLYFRLRKHALNYRKRHRLPYVRAKLISRQRILCFRLYIGAILAFFIVTSLYCTYLIFTDQTIIVSHKFLENYHYIFIGIILFTILTPLCFYIYAVSPPKTRQVKAPQEEDILLKMIQEKQQKEDEEWNRLMEEHQKDITKLTSQNQINQEDSVV